MYWRVLIIIILISLRVKELSVYKYMSCRFSCKCEKKISNMKLMLKNVNSMCFVCVV